MRKPIRIISLLLSSAILLAAAACADKSDGAQSESSAAAQSVTEAVTEKDDSRGAAKDNLPDDLDYDGYVMRILARGGDSDTLIEFSSEQTGDVVNDAVYERNLAVEERLDVKIKTILTNNTRHGNDVSAIRSSVQSGADDYDVIANHMYYTMSLALEKLFYNLNTLDYIDFSQPWWNHSYTELCNIDNKLYAAAGELALTMVSGAYCMFFDRDLFLNTYQNADLYEVVNSGAWTLDALETYCKGLYQDLNGDSKADQNDFYGLYVRDKQTLAADAFTGGVKLRVVEDDGSGSYIFSLENERTVQFTEKLRSLIYYNNTSCRGTYNDDTIMQTMLDGTTIFTPWMLGGINNLRDMQNNYGILPMPKLDETQDKYTSYAHNGFSIFTIPVTCAEADRSAAFLEAMCAESYRTVMPAYFETAMKVKYTRDEASAQMLDMISEGIYLDISYVFGEKLGGVVDIFRDLFAKEANCDKIMSTLASKEKSINRALENIMEIYAEMD